MFVKLKDIKLLIVLKRIWKNRKNMKKFIRIKKRKMKRRTNNKKKK